MLWGNSRFYPVMIGSCAIWATLALSGCAQSATPSQSATSLVTSCTFAPDQNNTFMGTWPATGVPVAFDTNSNFSAAEVAAVAAAAAVWNNHYKSVYGFQAFDLSNASLSTIPPVNSALCQESPIVSLGGAWTNPSTSAVIIYKKNPWPYGGSTTPGTTQSSGGGVLAITTLCHQAVSGVPLPVAFNAMIELNYGDFYNSGQAAPDLMGTIVHEFGHLAGLGHSCTSGSTDPGVPDCQSSNLNTEYSSAMMYPFVQLVNPVKALTPNDQGRGNCVFLKSHS